MGILRLVCGGETYPPSAWDVHCAVGLTDGDDAGEDEGGEDDAECESVVAEGG